MTIVDKNLTRLLSIIRNSEDEHRIPVGQVLLESLLRAQMTVAAHQLAD